MTRAIAIQPAPPVRPSTQCGVSARLKQAPPTPARAPPAMRVDVAVVRDADAHRVGRGGDSPTARTLRPGPRAREVERDDDDQPTRRRRATSARTGSARGWAGRRARRGRRARTGAGPGVGEAEVVAEVGREPGRAGEDRQRETRDDLVRAQRDHEEREDQRATPPARAATAIATGQHDAGRAADALHGPEAHHGADEHHPLDAEVEHARALGEQLAERGEEQRRAVGDRRTRARRRGCSCSRAGPARRRRVVAPSATNVIR